MALDQRREGDLRGLVARVAPLGESLQEHAIAQAGHRPGLEQGRQIPRRGAR